MQEDWLGTKDEIGSSNFIYIHPPQSGARIARPELQEVVQLLVMSIRSISKFLQSEIARGVPLPVYMNLDVYSGFWCTSHCVVF